jgi:hypothetical protein
MKSVALASVSKAAVAGAALVACLGFASREAAAYQLKHTPGGEVVRWQESSVALVVDPTVADHVVGGGAAVDAALHAWSGMEGSPTLSMTVGPGGGQVAVDGQNTVLVAPEGFAPAGNALAVTVLSYDNVSGRIVDTDVVFNGSHAFAVLAEGAQPASGTVPVSTDGASGDDDGLHGLGAGPHEKETFDFQHVAAHELGHVLGLGDQQGTQDALMYAYTSPGDASRRVPSTDDIDGIGVAYGGSAAHSGCGGASVAGSRTQAVDAFAALALFAGAGMWLTRRRGARMAAPVCACLCALVAGSGEARSATATGIPRAADAHAVVVSTETTNVGGVFQTTLRLAPTACRATACPDRVEARVWGGTLGGITQVVGEHAAPRIGDGVDVTLPAAGDDAQAVLVPQEAP